MEAVGYCDNDPQCINQAVEGAAMVGGIVTEVGTMVYGGPIFKAVDLIKTVSKLGELKSIDTAIDLMVSSNAHFSTISSWVSDPDRLLMILIGLEKNEADKAAVNKIEAWVNSPTKEPKLKGKQTKYSNERSKLKKFIKKIVGILNQIKKTLKAIFDIRQKFIDFLQRCRRDNDGYSSFLRIVRKIRKG